MIADIRKWWTAQECAETAKALGIGNVPTDKSAWVRLLKRTGLPGTQFCRPREGSKGGGGFEYAFDALPEAFQARLMAHQTLAAQKNREIAKRRNEERSLSAISVCLLNAHQRGVMEARAEILDAIDFHRLTNDLTDAQAIDAFIISPAAFGIEHETVVRANDRARADAKISRRTVYNWKQARRSSLAALAPRQKQTLPPSEQPWWGGFLSFYARPAKPDIRHALDLYRDSLDDPFQAPSYDQVRRELAKLNEIERHIGREGLLTLKSRLAYVTRGTENLFPTTIYTADGKTFDAEVAHPVHGKPFRPEITSVLDVATRKCVGIAISLKENVIAVSEALRKATVAHGIPAIFYADRGPGYRNKALDADATGMMMALSITKMHSLPYNSQARGIIERFNGSVWNRLAKEFPTYIGADMDREVKQKTFRRTRGDIREFGESRLLVSWEEFHERCQAAVDAYNDRPHDGLPKFTDPETGRTRHCSPNEFWAIHQGNGWEPVTVDGHEVDDLFRPYEVRTVRRALIEWNSNSYFHEALGPYHGQRVVAGYDIDDGSRLWVRELEIDADGNAQRGKLICVAAFSGNKRDYVPKSYQDAAEERRLKGRLQRIENHRVEAEAEARPGLLIDHQPGNVVSFLPVDPILTEAIEIERQQVAVPAKRNVFRTDADLATYALENGLEALAETQRSVLRSCLNNSADRELLRLNGVDLKELEALFRSAA